MVIAFMTSIIAIDINAQGLVQRHEVWGNATVAAATPDRRDGYIREGYGNSFAQQLHEYNETIPKDKEYGFGLTYRYRENKRVNFGFGLNVVKISQEFASPIRKEFFGPGPYSEELDVRIHHRLYGFQFSPILDLKFIDQNRANLASNKSFTAYTFGATAALVYAITYKQIARQRVLTIEHKVNRIDPFATEFYPGLSLSNGPFRFDVQYRAFQLRYRDDSAVNNGKRVDTYNPPKVRLALSCRLWQGPKKSAEPDTAAELMPD